jgi:hypothetical protein
MALPFAASEIYQYIRLKTYCQVNFGTSHSGFVHRKTKNWGLDEDSILKTENRARHAGTPEIPDLDNRRSNGDKTKKIARFERI